MKQRTAVQNDMIKKARNMFQKHSEQKIEEILEKNNWNENKALLSLAENGEQGNFAHLMGKGPELKDQLMQQILGQNPPPQKTFSELEKQLKQMPQHVWHSDIADQILKKQETENQQEEASLNNRVISLPVGVQNVNNQSFFSCVILILLQNPDLIEKILDYKPQNEDDEFTLSQQKFMNELQCLIVRYLLTNQRYVNPQAVYQAARDYFQRCQMEIEGQTLPQFYEIMLKCIDLGLVQKKNFVQGECPLNLLCTQYCAKQQLKQEEECLTLIKINPSDNFLYCTLINKISDEKKFNQLPKNLALNIRRTLKQSDIITHVDSDYWFPKKINLDFQTGEKKTSEIMNYLERSSNDLKNVQIQQEMLNDITIVLSVYEKQSIVPGDVIRSLKQEQQGLLEKLKKVFPRNQDNNNISQNISQSSENNYFLSLIGIQVLRNQDKQYYLYVQNFHTNQWFLHNGKQVQLETEEFVLNDATKNACFIMYVNSKQRERIQVYQKQLQDIESKVQINHGELSKDDYSTDTLLKRIPTMYTKLIELENKEFMLN